MSDTENCDLNAASFPRFQLMRTEEYTVIQPIEPKEEMILLKLQRSKTTVIFLTCKGAGKYIVKAMLVQKKCCTGIPYKPLCPEM